MFKKFKKKKEIENTHKLYSVEDFLLKENDIQAINRILNDFRCDFEPDPSDSKTATDLGMMMYTLPLFIELKYYYNNDFCMAMAQSMIISKKKYFDRRMKSYYFENAVIRVASIWEYLFIILNEYLQTGLIAGKDIREQLIEAGCHKIDFVPSGKGFEVKYVPIDSEERKKIEPELIKKYKLFKIAPKRSNNSFLKAVKKQYAMKDRIQLIFDIYNCEEVKAITNLRNEIVHRRPLSARFSLSPSDIMPGMAVSINPEGWYDFASFPQMIEKNILSVRDAIKLLYEVIFYNDIPNSKENENEKFEALEVRCRTCEKDILINSFSADYLIEMGHPLICPTCKQSNTTIINKREVHERYFFSNLNEYSDFLVKYWESNAD
ncbi:hypothetical protein QJ48_33205 [Paenibacillus sp. A3]|uniref:hypothetical protein n=1 Tax=Paenibacillus sp. A3 TaxID=1337054 RepID=UPI0006D53D04|nr:hypothetical protein [Paenibacillus sp. A3]KPV55432.1 hypothetical protein QJ48_33205 [Paenibacillus sp. A3]